MGDEIKDAVGSAAKELVKAGYEDALQPAAKEFGKVSQSAGKHFGNSLATVAEAVDTLSIRCTGANQPLNQTRDRG